MKAKIWKRIGIVTIILVLIATAAVVGILGANAYVKTSVKERIFPMEEAAALDADCILVLGAGVWEDGTPSFLLRDRLERGVELYRLGASDRMLMTGDHGREDYDEVNVMKQYAVEREVPSDAVFMDHAGFSTYESMYRAKKVFCAEKIVIVTQSYHLYRALYDAEKLGLEAYGVAADQAVYSGQSYRDFREILARGKDFIWCIFKPKPTYLGETIPVSGNGNLTNDK